MDQNQIQCHPINFGPKDMFEILTSSIIEIVALDTVIHMREGVQVAHFNLDGH